MGDLRTHRPERREVIHEEAIPMAYDQSNKRPKSADDARDSRNDGLESEIHALRSENARLRLKLQRLEGHHDVLPVVAQSPTVDLSRFDTGLVSQIPSFVGTSRELLNLALTCKSFGSQQPATGLDGSLVERVARHAVCSGRNDIDGVRISLPQYARGRTTWLSILHESEHPLKFDTLLGRGIEHGNERRTSVKATSVQDFITVAAVASNYVMDSGVHYAEFQINAGGTYIGIVRPMPNLDPGRYADDSFSFTMRRFYGEFLALRTDEWGGGGVHACLYSSLDGCMAWTDWRDRAIEEWEGSEDCQVNDTIGMLLDFNNGTLAVYKNNRRLGVMKDGLSGSYCWYVSAWARSAVAIKRNSLPEH